MSINIKLSAPPPREFKPGVRTAKIQSLIMYILNQSPCLQNYISREDSKSNSLLEIVAQQIDFSIAFDLIFKCL